jgi:hypothetical protein
VDGVNYTQSEIIATAEKMEIEFYKTGHIENLHNLKMSCIPSKPKYGEVDLCFFIDGGAPVGLAGVETNYLNFANRKILGREIARRWNAYKTLFDAVEDTLNENCHLADGDECTLLKLKTAFENASSSISEIMK